ncbi:hypothetical protein QCA50_007696 [Cerrena zonata]|uniref:Protein kinase domain-containing protein n=1 Tax=Cerrena zonata TaxID=2478898 RepID=A0AAW0GJ14_9APHY
MRYHHANTGLTSDLSTAELNEATTPQVAYVEPPSDFDKLAPDEASSIWTELSPLLQSHKLWLDGTEEYEKKPPPPMKDPEDPFCVKDDENHLVFAPGIKRRRVFSYRILSPTHRISIDQFGRMVHIRAVHKNDIHLEALKRLSVAHPLNRVVPVLSLIRLQEWVLICQPYWGKFWYFRDEITHVQLWRITLDLLEGLVFMHEWGVSHGDIHQGNILYNHSDIGPRQTDPIFRVGYIDFGSAFVFPIDATDHTVTHAMAQTTPPSGIKAPEQSLNEGSWDAYAADVYNLGAILKEEIAGEDFTLLDDMIAQMTPEDPSKRITAKEALNMIQNALTKDQEACEALGLVNKASASVQP